MQVRNPGFDFSEIEADASTHYFGGNALATHMLNSFHVIVPVGERFFIRSVQHFADRADEKNCRQIKQFYGQENMHDKKHVEFWQVLKRQGYNVDAFYNHYSRQAFGFYEPLLRKIFGPRFSLSLTVALEHYTALMAEAVLAPKSRIFERLAPQMRRLMLWHAAEELEHKAVAIDLYRQVGGGYPGRIFGFVMASISLSYYMYLGMLFFLFQDRQMTARKYFTDLLGVPRLSWRFAWVVFKGILKYLMPGFHPDKTDNYHLAVDYLEKTS